MKNKNKFLPGSLIKFDEFSLANNWGSLGIYLGNKGGARSNSIVYTILTINGSLIEVEKEEIIAVSV